MSLVVGNRATQETFLKARFVIFRCQKYVKKEYMEMTKKIYLEPFKKCPGLLYFPLLTISFLACWFLKHDIWTCCEKLWVNVIFVWIAAVFHSFLFFLLFISFVGMDYQKFSSSFQVLGLSASVHDVFLPNT